MKQIIILIILALIPLDIYAHMETPYNVPPRLVTNCER